MPKKTRPTIEELIAKYPDMKVNTNCLHDWICPDCGNRDRFRVDVTQMATMTDNGIEDYGASDYYPEDYCRCEQCDLDGTVEDFQFEGLDAALKARKEHHA